MKTPQQVVQKLFEFDEGDSMIDFCNDMFYEAYKELRNTNEKIYYGYDSYEEFMATSRQGRAAKMIASKAAELYQELCKKHGVDELGVGGNADFDGLDLEIDTAQYDGREIPAKGTITVQYRRGKVTGSATLDVKLPQARNRSREYMGIDKRPDDAV